MLDELLKGCERREDLLGDGGLMKDLKTALMQRMLGAERAEQLGYAHGQGPPIIQTNRRSGVSHRAVRSEGGAFEIEIEVPRGPLPGRRLGQSPRGGRAAPRLIAAGQTRIDGLDETVIAMQARGMSLRVLRSHLEDLYGLEVSPDLISRVTGAVLDEVYKVDEVKDWRPRPSAPRPAR